MEVMLVGVKYGGRLDMCKGFICLKKNVCCWVILVEFFLGG